jgi:hypothetical protein
MPSPLRLMASTKFRPTALQWFFRISTYNLYAFTPEKPLSLVERNFCLTILKDFAIGTGQNGMVLQKHIGRAEGLVFRWRRKLISPGTTPESSSRRRGEVNGGNSFQSK